MKKIGLLLILVLSVSFHIEAQKFFTRAGEISFLSTAMAETIEAKNTSATCVIDLANGNIQLAVLIKGFQFEKALMQEHFNENYMESDQFPKAKFKGKIINIESVDLSKEGNYTIQVKGDLTIHGVTQNVSSTGEINILDGQLTTTSSFEVAVADYNISIPSVVREKIAKKVIISIKANLEELKK